MEYTSNGSNALHAQGNENAVISQSVVTGNPVSLKIEMDPLYAQDVEIVPLECFVNNYKILDQGCASAGSPIGNFTKLSVGNFRSNFNMFRTIVNGVPQSDLIFKCTLFVCHLNQCPDIPCIDSNY